MNSKTARSIIYIFFISGLLTSTSLIIMILWNLTLSHLIQWGHMTFLESVGIVSFVYVIYFGIKFGENSVNDNSSLKSMTSFHHPDRKSSKIPLETLNKVPEDEKQELMEFISRCVGEKKLKNADTPHSSFSRHQV